MSWSAFQAPNDIGSSSFAATKLRAMLIARTAYWVSARPSESRVIFCRVGFMADGPGRAIAVAPRRAPPLDWMDERPPALGRGGAPGHARLPGRRPGAERVPAHRHPGHRRARARTGDAGAGLGLDHHRPALVRAGEARGRAGRRAPRAGRE